MSKIKRAFKAAKSSSKSTKSQLPPKFQIGDRVKIPKQKTYDIDLESCGLIQIYKKMEIKPKFVYINNYYSKMRVYKLGFTPKVSNSTFHERDLELYTDLDEIKDEICSLLDIN